MNTEAPLRIAASLIFLFLTITSSLGQHMNEKASHCPNAVTTRDMAECFSKAKDSSDAKLVAVYSELLHKLDRDDAGRLTDVQRVWGQYRDANCSAERALYQGGTAAPVVYLACLNAMTRGRTRELRQTYAVRLKQ